MITTKGRYAVRVMLDLAQHEGESPVSLNEIAERQFISKKYLEAIMRNLVSAKLVEASRGKYGGYRLVRSPSDYPIGEILEAAEGPLAPVACLKPDAELCPIKDQCKSLPLWKRYDDLIADFFNSNTLQSVLEESA